MPIVGWWLWWVNHDDVCLAARNVAEGPHGVCHWHGGAHNQDTLKTFARQLVVVVVVVVGGAGDTPSCGVWHQGGLVPGQVMPGQDCTGTTGVSDCPYHVFRSSDDIYNHWVSQTRAPP